MFKKFLNMICILEKMQKCHRIVMTLLFSSISNIDDFFAFYYALKWF